MHNSEQTSNTKAVSLLVHHEVQADSLKLYEVWLKKVIDIASGFSGHEGVFVIKPEHNKNKYEIAVRFTDEDFAKAWLNSTERQQLIAEIKPALLSSDDVEIQAGIDYWFSSIAPPMQQPVRWKQWLLLAAATCILMLVFEPVFSVIFESVPLLGAWGIRHFIVAFFNVALLVFIIMPYLVKLTSTWLNE
jgi:uncharacterized protein